MVCGGEGLESWCMYSGPKEVEWYGVWWGRYKEMVYSGPNKEVFLSEGVVANGSFRRPLLVTLFSFILRFVSI